MRYILTVDEINRRKPEDSYLLAVSLSRSGASHQTRCVCKCKCGVVKSFTSYSVIKGTSLSCGCKRSERAYNIEQVNDKKPQHSCLTAIKFEEPEYQGRTLIRRVLCKCKCGKEIITRMASVINGHTWSCGCQRKSQLKKGSKTNKKSVKHSQYHYHIAALYSGMMSRCYNKKDPSYKNYGAKGVTVYKEWRKSYQLFLNWCLSNGWSKGLHLDKDILSGRKLIYSPKNCCFVTPVVNLANRTNTRKAMFNGKITAMTEISKRLNIGVHYLYRWHGRGLSIEKITKRYQKYKRA